MFKVRGRFFLSHTSLLTQRKRHICKKQVKWHCVVEYVGYHTFAMIERAHVRFLTSKTSQSKPKHRKLHRKQEILYKR